MAPRGPWALTLRSLAKLSPEEREPQHCLIVAGNEILEKLAKRDTQDVFAEPVDTSVVTDYLTIVKKPMDLGTVREKLNRGQYTCVEELREDIDLIWDNCCLYNAPETEFYTLAVKLREVTVKLFEQLEMAFQEINVEPPRRRSVQRASQAKEEQRNSKQDSCHAQERDKLSEQYGQSSDGGKKDEVDQQESMEQTKPLVLRGPKRKPSNQDKLKDTLNKKPAKDSCDFKLLKYTHFQPLLETMLSDRSENSPLQESAKAVAEKVLKALERFFQASAPTARLLLSQWLHNSENGKEAVDWWSEEEMQSPERKKSLAKLLLQQAGFDPSEFSFDIDQSKETESMNVSKLLWNLYRSNLLEQESSSDSYSSGCNLELLERHLSEQVLYCSPRSLILGEKNVLHHKEPLKPDETSSAMMENS